MAGLLDLMGGRLGQTLPPWAKPGRDGQGFGSVNLPAPRGDLPVVPDDLAGLKPLGPGDMPKPGLGATFTPAGRPAGGPLVDPLPPWRQPGPQGFAPLGGSLPRGINPGLLLYALGADDPLWASMADPWGMNPPTGGQTWRL